MASDSGFLFDYLREDYDRETERLARLRERIAFFSSFLLLLGAGIASLVTGYIAEFENHRIRDSLFLVGMLCSIIYFTKSLVLLSRCVVQKFRFANPATANVVLASYRQWEAHSAHSSVSPKPDIELILTSQLCDAFAKAATHNRLLTDRRSDDLYSASRSAFLSAIILLVPTACLVLRLYDHESVPIQVEIVSPEKPK